ncbi:phosphate ABC transporter ATP-binding protein PstB [Salinisphaera sp. P385]|uniref:Phosphate ABC transporter ATP-binding protein PstB n=2 Tax=Spectribacter acetivorans TaxID=3075603 RepID=A0ABU3B3D8_9GAMM|nr:phosphate ABC transporter ATP-binding protein PstB [Salinisphaera sp. P385]MDT0616975.1 phosphate ABC transporter ATP-binding protein PstB [Salinisphaera sp. P385]
MSAPSTQEATAMDNPDQQATAEAEAPAAGDATSSQRCRAEVRDLSFWYGEFQALSGISLPVLDRQITALIGASGCGKSTFLRCFNRMHDLYPGNHYQGEINLQPENVNIISTGVSAMWVRLHVGMVFQKPNPFPKSIYDNVASGLQIRGIRKRAVVDDAVERSLKQAALWDEVKDRLTTPALDLSGGQQQRLCIARALATEPELLLLDEPTSALDPIATAKIEDLITDLRSEITVLIVTHNMQQAARISDYTAFMHLGELVEYDETDTIFTSPSSERTSDYITGRFG